MRETMRNALVPYTAEQMFALVEDFERYPQFVPWVVSARLVERGADVLVGRLEMHREPLRETFTAQAVLARPHQITLRLLEGSFRTFEGRWTFEPLGERGCKVSLVVRFEFMNPLFDLLLSRRFEKSCGEMVDAFVRRARALYGSSG